MKPLSNKSFNCSFNSFISVGLILYGGIETRRVSRIMSMPKFIILSGGTLGSLLGKTSGNFLLLKLTEGKESQHLSH